MSDIIVTKNKDGGFDVTKNVPQIQTFQDAKVLKQQIDQAAYDAQNELTNAQAIAQQNYNAAIAANADNQAILDQILLLDPNALDGYAFVPQIPEI